jgi:hypothetical protein
VADVHEAVDLSREIEVSGVCGRMRAWFDPHRYRTVVGFCRFVAAGLSRAG